MALNPDYMLAPSLQEYFVDKTTGLPLSGGFVYSYIDGTNILKPVYNLTGSSSSPVYTALPNPIPLSGVGTITDGSGNDILPYWFPFDTNGNVQLYKVVVKDSIGTTQFTRQAWPNTATAVTPGTAAYTYNYVRNWQFFSWSNSISYAPVGIGSVIPTDFIIDDWLYQQNDAGQIINITQGIYTLGVDSVPTNSPFYLNYNNTSVTGVGTYNRFAQNFDSVETLAGQQVAVEIWLQSVSGALGPISIDLRQFFGSGGGGSADFVNPIFNIPTITTSWARYTGSALITSTTSKTRGANGDDTATLEINMPLNVAANINIGSVRLELGNAITGTQLISNDDMVQQTNTFAIYPTFTTGDVKATVKIAADPGWLMMNNGTIGDQLSGSSAYGGQGAFALFTLLWNNIAKPHPSYCPMLSQSGLPISPGISALSDWINHDRLTLPNTLGRSLAGAGTPVYILAFTANSGTDEITVVDATWLPTSQAVTVSTNGVLPSPLTISTTYYVINTSSTTVQLAASLSDAINNIPITLTTNGSGTNFLSVTPNATYNLGQPVGDEAIKLSQSNLPDHLHNGPGGRSLLGWQSNPGSDHVNIIPAGASGNILVPTTNEGTTGTVTGGAPATPFLLFQPTIFMNFMIKL